MTIKEHMTWRSDSKRWVKKHLGELVYASYRKLKTLFPHLVTACTKDGTREAANAFWEQFISGKQSVPKLSSDYERLVAIYRQMRDWHLSQGNHEAAAQCNDEATAYEAQGLSEDPPKLSSLDNPLRHSEIGAAVWQDRFQQMRSKVIEYSVAKAIREFLDFKRAAVDNENLTADAWDSLRCHLGKLDEYRGGEAVALSEINEDFVEGYYLWLMSQVKKKKYAADYAHSIFAAFKSFVRHHWRRRRLELPRNLDEPALVFKRKGKAIILWEREEIHRFVEAANDRTRLYALLALNCGFYSSDIATLSAHEVDFVEGRITRRRHKTEDHETVPIISWKLWPETLRLLTKERNPEISLNKKSKSDLLVLLNDEGRPLRTSELTDKFRKTDNIRNAINRVCYKLKVRKTAKQLRKTSASTLETHEVYGRYAQHFLGHAPSSIASKHYVLPSQDQFDRAVEWLGRELGVDKGPDTPMQKRPA